MTADTSSLKIGIAGAFGFVGQHLMDFILRHTHHRICALSRYARKPEDPRIECIVVDLYSLEDSIAALAGCDIGIYLVHSMSPHSRLMQGDFKDFDFLLADNFARAAAVQKLRHIIYVGGIIPKEEALSPHLQSRLEVEETLGSHGVPLTAFRCGLIIGRGGTSFNIILKLVDRLPLMLLPQWLQTQTEPVFVRDLVFAIKQALEHPTPSTGKRIVDLVGTQTMSHRDLIHKIAKFRGKKRILISIPFLALGISKFWIRLISSAPKELLYPLLGSIHHHMLSQKQHQAPIEWGLTYTPIDLAIKYALVYDDVHIRAVRLHPKTIQLSEVRSIQRISHLHGRSMEAVVRVYANWMPLVFLPFLKVEHHGTNFTYLFRPLNLRLIQLEADPCSEYTRYLLRVTGGLLARSSQQRGEFEFRCAANQRFAIILLQRFKPALPWPIYKFSQAIVHNTVMHAFVKYLRVHDEKRQNQTTTKNVLKFRPPKSNSHSAVEDSNFEKVSSDRS
ncbi:MAG: NAD(P)H-binding protein [Zetaproteobacteria bacterium]|nr:NAD(P)H-binding protein [Zetaproteobacteria bacterium]